MFHASCSIECNAAHLEPQLVPKARNEFKRERFRNHLRKDPPPLPRERRRAHTRIHTYTHTSVSQLRDARDKIPVTLLPSHKIKSNIGRESPLRALKASREARRRLLEVLQMRTSSPSRCYYHKYYLSGRPYSRPDSPVEKRVSTLSPVRTFLPERSYTLPWAEVLLLKETARALLAEQLHQRPPRSLPSCPVFLLEIRQIENLAPPPPPPRKSAFCQKKSRFFF